MASTRSMSPPRRRSRATRCRSTRSRAVLRVRHRERTPETMKTREWTARTDVSRGGTGMHMKTQRAASGHEGRVTRARVRPERSDLAHHLDATGITGDVATPRESNLSHIGRFLRQERQFDFGVPLIQEWTE